MDTILCVFLAYIFTGFVRCDDVLQRDRVTYVSTTGIDNISCFNAGIDNPCRSFNYVLLNSKNSCDDNCVIIILDSQSRVINSTNNIVFRINQSLHVSSVNLQMVNVSFGDIQISSNGSSNLTFEYLILVLGSVSFSSFKQVEFRNVVIKYSYYFSYRWALDFSNIETVIMQHAYFQTSLSESAESLVSAERVNTAVFMNCSFLRNAGNILLDICATKIIIEHCTFDNNVANHVYPLLNIRVCCGEQRFDYNITNCNFNNNTATYLLKVLSVSNFSSSGFMIISSNIFKHNSVYNQDEQNSALISVSIAVSEEEHLVQCLLTNNSITNNVGSAVVFAHSSNVTFENTSFVHNSIPQKHFDATTNKQDAVVYINGGVFKMKYVLFYRNTATPLVLIGTQCYFIAITEFLNNIAMYGGGIFVDSNAIVTFYKNSKVVFGNNTAQYGGAVFIGRNNYCVINEPLIVPFNLIFNGNSARTSGANIYSYHSWCICSSYHTPSITWDTDPLIVSYPININVSSDIEVYPGKNIKLNFKLFDCNNTGSTCVADVFLGCNDNLFCIYNSSNTTEIQLAGPPTVFLSSGNIDTGLVIQSTHDLIHRNESPKLYFQCRNPPTGIKELIVSITIHLIDCPLGLVYETTTKQCRCADNNSDIVWCSSENGQICIRNGHWYTHNMEKPIVISCPYYSYCDFSRKACPAGVEYIVLPQIQDDQCRDGHGGTLCMNCAENRTFTYLALKCIDNIFCRSWHPYILLMLTVSCPFLIGISLILAVQIQSDIGSGYLYGPLFFLAVLSQLPLGEYPTLDKIVSVFAANVLLQFKVFGFIPWCFFPSMNPLYSTFLQFLNPIIMFVVLLTTVFIAQRCPRKFLTLQRSPMQAMCILILVSYWSLIRTSILILTPVYFNENVVVLLQPDLLYLNDTHIPLWITSLLIVISLGALFF